MDERYQSRYKSFWASQVAGQRSLAGYSPWGRKELDTTEQLSMHVQPRKPSPTLGFPAGIVVKNLPAMQEMGI